MIKNLDFVTDLEVKQYYLRMVSFIITSYGLSEAEAMHRVAHFAKRVKPTSSWQILHRSVEYWAEGVCYKLDGKGNKTDEIKPLPFDE